MGACENIVKGKSSHLEPMLHQKARPSITATYREMGMTFWLEKAEVALGPRPRNITLNRVELDSSLKSLLSRSYR